MSIVQPIILKKGGYTASQTDFIDYLQNLQVVRDALSIDVHTEKLQFPTPTDGKVPVIKLWERLIGVERNITNSYCC